MTRNRLKLLILPGDGIGPEIVNEAMKIIRLLMEKGIAIEIEEASIGGSSIDQVGKPITEETLEKAKQCDAVLLGAVGGPKWEGLPHELRPEQGLLRLRKELGLFANLRPVRVFEPLIDASPLKREIIEGVDFIVVRELTGGIYFGQPRGKNRKKAFNTEIYHREEIERIGRIAFQLACKRRKNLVSVDKANVLESSVLWREVITELHKEFMDVELTHQYVDNCAMQIIKNPGQFDVILTNNIFGDILSDESAMLTGSIGMLPSASLGVEHALYEPIHGSAPDIAGKNTANPCAEILCLAMMFRYTFNLPEIAQVIESATEDTLKQGYRTPDIAGKNTKILSTSQMGDMIKKRVEELL